MPSLWFAALDPWNLPATDAGIRQGDEYLSLFTPNVAGGWNSDASLDGIFTQVGVFKIYHQFAENASPEQLKNLSQWALAHGIKLALETPCLFTNTSNPGEGFIAKSDFVQMLSRLQQNGVDISYIAMDSPLYEGYIRQLTGNISITSLATQISDAVDIIQGYFPTASIGDIEPLPATPSNDVQQWLAAYKDATGKPLEFFDADINWSLNGYIQSLQDIVPVLRASGISYGVIFNGTGADTNNVAWVNDAILHYQQIDAYPALQPDTAIFQSWDSYPTIILPPATPGSLTHVIASYLEAPAAPVISVSDGQTAVSRHWLPGGSALAGSNITVLDNGAVIGTGLVHADGSWNIQITLDGTGLHTLTAFDISAAGVSGAMSKPVTFDYELPDSAITAIANLGSAGSAKTGSTDQSTLNTMAESSIDEVSFDFDLGQANITHTLAGALVISGPDGVAHLIDSAASTFIFQDGAINEHPTDGNPLIDPLYYYSMNPTLWAAHVDPTQNYMTTGWRLGLNPNAWFDTNYYMSQNPDVAASGLNPLIEYDQTGWKQGRDPSPIFSTGQYLTANPDVATAGLDPLLDYITTGLEQGLTSFLSGPPTSSDPLIEASYYDPQLGVTFDATALSAQAEAAASYLAVGWKLGLNPNAWFNTDYYLSHNPDVAASGMNPLLHYEEYGWKEGRNPSAMFNTIDYLAANTDVAASGVDPLLQFVTSGLAEGRPLAPGAGSRNPGSSLLNFVLALVSPKPLTIDSEGGVVSDDVKVVSGTNAKVGSTISISDQGNVVGTASVGADGSWNTNIVLNGPGTNVLTVSDVYNVSGISIPNALLTYLLNISSTVGVDAFSSGIQTGLGVTFCVLSQPRLDVVSAIRLANQVLKSGNLLANQGQTVTVDPTTTVVGAGEDFFGDGGRTVFLRNGAGELTALSFNSAGVLSSSQVLTNQGQAATVDATTTVVGAGEDFFGNGGRTVFLSDNGALVAWGFDSSGAINAAEVLANQGQTVTVDPTTTVVGAGEDFFGDGGRTVFLRNGAGELTALSFNSAGVLSSSQVLTNQGQAATVDATTTVVGAGEDFFGNGGRTVFLSDNGALVAWGFDSSGAINAAEVLANQGQTVTVDPTTTVVGAGEDFFGDGGRTVFLRNGAGELTALSFNSAGVLSSSQVLTNQGQAATVDATTTVVGAGEDFFGNGGRTVFLSDNGALVAWGFDSSGAINAAEVLANQGQTVTVDPTTTVVGAGEDFFGDGGRTVFLRNGAGELTALSFNSAGVLSSSQVLTNQGQAATVDATTTVVGAGEDFFGNGGRTVFLSDNGALVAWGFDSSGAINAAEVLANQGQTVTVDPTTTVVGAGEDFFGDGGRTVFLRNGAGELTALSFNSANGLSYSSEVGIDVSAGSTIAVTVNTVTSGSSTTSSPLALIKNEDTTSEFLITSQSGLVNAAEQLVTGVGAEAGSIVSIHEGTSQLGSGVANADGSWSIGVVLNGNGQHVLSVTDRRVNGTVASAELAPSYTLNSTVSVPTITERPEFSTSMAQQLTGTGDAGTLITVQDGTTELGNGLVGADGVWTMSITLSNQIGSHLLVATDTDAAGNVGVSAPTTIYLAPSEPDPLFDTTYYLAHNPEVAASGVDPYQQFLEYGWKQGRNPSALFSTTYYLDQNPDVAAAGVDPLLHYETFGWKEGRDPSILFSTSAYLTQNPDVAAAGIDPLTQYAVGGQSEGRAIDAAVPHPTGPQNPLVDASYIYAERPDVAAAGMDATAWFDTFGWHEGADPDALFDTKFYLQQNPDVATAGINPLLHYETFGWHEGRDPSLTFSTNQYLSSNPDVNAAHADPLQHYIDFGQNEGRSTFLTGDNTAPPNPLVNTAFYDAQLGATLFPIGAAGQAQATSSYTNGGWQAGRNPDQFFDTNYYLSQNTDVAAAHVDPLLHYETYGWKEGRNPSTAFSTNAYLANNSDVAAAKLDPLLHYVEFGQSEGRAIYAV